MDHCSTCWLKAVTLLSRWYYYSCVFSKLFSDSKNISNWKCNSRKCLPIGWNLKPLLNTWLNSHISSDYHTCMLGLSKLYLKSMNHLISLLFSLPRENKRLITVTVFLLWEPFCIPSYQVKCQWDAKWHNDFTLLQNSSSTVCLGSPHTPRSSSSFPLCYIFNHGFFCRRYLTWCFWSFFFFPPPFSFQ